MFLPSAPNIRWHWILLLFNLSWFSYIDTKEVRVVCYYTNWSVYRPGTAKFSPQNINPYLCTHLVYAFGGFTKDNILKPFDKYQDIEKGGYAKFTGLKTYNKQLKTLLAIGGWNEGSSKFSPLVASTERRRELVKNVVKFLRQNHFDGLDLDWEYPSFRDGGKPRDRDNYAQFVQELREEFERENEKTGRPRLLLTMAVPAGIEYINKGYDIPKLTKYLDWMNILSYDYHSAFEPSVNHHAPLYPLEAESEYNYDTELNIDYTIKHYLKMGADSKKLVLGIPTYGRSYTLFNPDSSDIGAPADGPGDMGDATRENGYLAYYEICENVKSKEWTVVQPNEDAMGPYAYKNNQWVGYDDENIVRRKAEYVAKNSLGGIMFWAIDNDDFRGVCHNKPYPLIEASKEALIKAYGFGNQTSTGSQRTSSRTRTRGHPSTTSRPTTAPDRSINDTDDIQKPARRRTSSSNRKASGSRRRRPSTTRGTTTTTDEPLIIGSSLLVTTPSYKTPEPPTTPDPGGDFKCEEEGFYPHPRDCKKYFWCLAGPSELGIIAHQFTCPSGLYFNKAASSCDYTQNVLCNKKKTTTSATPTTTTPTSAQSSKSTSTTEKINTVVASLFSTRRPLPKITAATSRTTFKATTTTTEEPEYEDDYEEYEDDGVDKGDSEEDPQVIKELLNLIKKAGGIDELEKQLKLHEHDHSAPGEKSTKSTISKELYERVLKRTKSNEDRENNIHNFRYNTINRNSRGPQNLGITPEVREEKTQPKYSTISRQRNGPQGVEEDDDDDNDDDDDDDKNKAVSARSQNIPEYVTIRRTRYSTTEANLIAEDISLKDNEEDTPNHQQQSFTTKSPGLQYSSIRRTTSKSNDIVEEPATSSTTAKPYFAIRRSRPTTTSTPPSSTVVVNITTTKSSTIVEDYTKSLNSSSTAPETRTTIPVIEVIDERTGGERIPDNPTSGTNTSPISDAPSLSDNKLTHHILLNPQQTDPVVTSPPTKSFIQLAKPRPFSFTPRLLVRPSSTSPPPRDDADVVTASSAADKVSQSTQQQQQQQQQHQQEHNIGTGYHSTTTPLVNNHPPPPSVLRETATVRGRGASRFRLNQSTSFVPSSSSSSRSQGAQDDDHRQYRPDMAHAISDLSSLTALDLALDGNEVRSTHRGRRPTPINRRRTTTQVPSLIHLSSPNPPDEASSASSSTVRQSVKPTRRVIKVFRPQLRHRLTSSTPIVPELSNSISYSSSGNRFSSSDEDQTEDENINLSETIRQESNDIGNSFGSTDEKGRRIIKRIRSTTTVRPTSEDFATFSGEDESSTGAMSSTVNDHPRTRKIIRKLPVSTTESLPHEFRVAHLGRTRKIIRRLSTTPSTIAVSLSEEHSTIKSRLLTYSRTRPTTTSTTTTTEAAPTTLSADEDVVLTTTDILDDDSLNTILDNTSTDNYPSTISLDDENDGTTLQSTTEESTTAKSTTLNYISKSIRNRIKLQEEEKNDSSLKIRPIKLTGLGTRQNYFNRPENSLEDRPEKPLTERPANSYRRNRFRPKISSSTTEDNVDDLKNLGGTTAGSYKRKPYRFRSTTSSSTTTAADEEEDPKQQEEEIIDENRGRESTTNKSQVKMRFRPSFASSTSTTSTTTAESTADIELSNKRKQLFNRERVMNTPYIASTISSTEASEGTTEKPTTLHHVFAQTDQAESSTDSIDDSTKKVERLIEISRIIDNGDVVINKIGEISRITSIKVVDNEINGTKLSEGPVYIHESTHNERQEKKYDSISKDSSAHTNIGNVITIDGKSSVKTITARPFSKNESSTIPLEGLFQTESPFRSTEDGDAPPLVKIRLLEQDPFSTKSELDQNDIRLVPVRVLNAEEATMKANVVEVKPNPNGTETIRIAPITFEKQIKNAK